MKPCNASKDSKLVGPRRETCTPMLTAALFTIAKRWKQSKCPSADNGSKKCGIHNNGILFNLRKGNPIIATVWMNPKNTVLSEVSESLKDRV